MLPAVSIVRRIAGNFLGRLFGVQTSAIDCKSFEPASAGFLFMQTSAIEIDFNLKQFHLTLDLAKFAANPLEIPSQIQS
jgi:hypothetical protein